MTVRVSVYGVPPGKENTATRAWLRCAHCGAESNTVHDRGCVVCAPFVPNGTPGAVEVTWWADLNPQQTA